MLRGALVRVVLSAAVAVSGLVGTSGVVSAAAGVSTVGPSAALHAPVPATVPAVTTPAAGSFTDVASGAQFSTEIQWLADQEISTGWAQPDGTREYRPLLPVARDAMAAFMYRLDGSPAFTPPAVSPFTDITPSTQFYKEITWLATQNISTGWTEADGTKTYRPLESVGRDAMAAFMYRLDGSPAFTPPAVSPFTDITPSTQFYKEITWLATQNISTGWTESDGTKTYRPLNSVNRDAMAAFMYRFYRLTHPLTVTDGSFHDGIAGARYLEQLTATGGIEPLAWTATGLPAGLTLTPDGAVAGIPTGTGTATASFTVTDAAGSTATVTRTISVPTSMPTGCIGQACAVLTPASSTVHVPATAITGVTRDAATQKIATATLTGPSVNGVTITSGQILVLAPAPGIDSGAIGAITGVTSNFDGTVTTALTPRTPADAYTDGTVNAIDPTMPTTGADASPVSYQGAGNPMASTALYRQGAGPVVVPASAVTTKCEASAQITLTGLALTSTLTPSMAAKWSLMGLDRFQFDLDGAITINTGASLSGQGSCTVTFPQGHAIVPAGDLGVIVFNIQPVLKFSASGKVDISGSVKLGCGSEYVWQGGNSHTTQHCGDTVTPVGFTSATGAKANATGTINVGMALDDMVGVTGNLTAALDANYTPLSHPIFTLDGTVGYELGGCLACFWPKDPQVTIATGTFYHHRLFKLDTPPSAATTAPTGPLTITTGTLPSGTVGSPYRTYLTAAGGTGPYTWNITTGALPAGLHLEPTTGAITGTPTTPGTTGLTITATDNNSTTASTRLILTVASQPAYTPLAITTTQLPQATVGTGYQAVLTASGGTAPYTWSQSGLPAGLTLDSATGQISGTPSATVTASVTFTVTDYQGHQQTFSTSITIVRTEFSNVASIATAGNQVTYGLWKDGTVWSWGGNTTGSFPTQKTGISGVASVLTSFEGSTYALKSDGTLWAWGDNAYGQLGDGTTSFPPAPTQVQGLTNVSAVTENDYSAYAVKTDGTAWAWGWNMYGALGIGTTDNATTPVQIAGLAGVRKIVAVNSMDVNSAYALLSDGTVWAWGYGVKGTTDYFSTTPVKVAGLGAVRSIAAANGSAYALLVDGTVWSWGNNSQGRLGDGSTTSATTPVQVHGLSGVASIAATGTSAYAVTTDGSVWAWGANGSGQLGNGTLTSSNLPVQIPLPAGVTKFTASDTAAYAVTANGVWRWGDGTTAPAQVPGLSGVESVTVPVGSHIAFAVQSDGTAWAWGDNTYGAFGDGTTVSSSTPVRVGG